MAGKQYEVVRPFRRVDPESGDVTEFEPGDTYSGPIENEDHYVGPKGPDGKGPLVATKAEVKEAEKAAADAAQAAEVNAKPGSGSSANVDSGKGK